MNIRPLLLIAVLFVATTSPQSVRAEVASAWSDGYNSKTRLIAGTVGTRTMAGVEIAIPDGWKTYWRNPGDAGGVPPYFDWAASENLASAKVLFPAPVRMKDATGDAVGYKRSVVFPVEIAAKDPAKPVKLNLTMEYGVCREICVPAEAKLSLLLPAATSPAPPSLIAALDAVPRPKAERRKDDPELKTIRAALAGDKPRLDIDVAFAGNSVGADVFVEASDGIYLSLPRKTGSTGGLQTFELDLSTGVDVAELKGKTLLVTMVSAAGQSEATWKVD